MLNIPKAIYDQMLVQARAEAPNECCGLLAGRDGTVDRIFPMTNIERSPVRYLIDPKEQFAAFKDMRAKETELLAIYHSHPQTEAYPSATDVRLAYYPDAVYIVISLRDRGRPVVNAYRIVDDTITPEEWKVDGPTHPA
ncbi:MAG TPA: M67 family metallopeptidase [Nitrospiria bacterium]|nr:M67 family metallopeptidase [Nitrospiria bacterium]